ncbi:RNA polymerase sigma factor [candidate division KSB1 bacterium]|nr:RNA polymerase sigma factor [candidate division KSB1 bacterium]
MANTGTHRQTDSEFFNSLFSEHQRPVYRFAYYLTQNRDATDELFQETWLKVAQNILKIREATNPQAWILTVTANLFKDQLRKKRIRRILTFQSFGSDSNQENATSQVIPVHIEDPIQFELKESLQCAISKLPVKQKQVFILKEIEGYKHHEIAEILHIPTGTVKSLLFRAVKRLQTDLKEYQKEV